MARTLTCGTNTISVVAADFNSDGILDHATCNIGSDDVYVRFGTGGGFFSDPTIYPVGAEPYSLTTADFNLDGHPDLATANSGVDNNITILLGSAGGTFTAAPVSPGASPNPVMIISADWNNDGIPDLAVLNNFTPIQVRAYIGMGTGAFTTSGTVTGIGGLPFGLTSGDFNNDGKADIAVQRNSTSIGVALGNGDGTFAALSALPTQTDPKSIAAAHLNNDGALDLIAANQGSDSISVLIGTGTGSFAAAVNYPACAAGGGPRCLTVGDFNNDTNTDVIVAHFSQPLLSFFAGTGTGTLQAYTTVDLLTANANYRSIITADFNGDTAQDFATANFDTNDSIIMFGTGSGAFTVPVVLSAFGVE